MLEKFQGLRPFPCFFFEFICLRKMMKSEVAKKVIKFWDFLEDGQFSVANKLHNFAIYCAMIARLLSKKKSSKVCISFLTAVESYFLRYDLFPNWKAWKRLQHFEEEGWDRSVLVASAMGFSSTLAFLKFIAKLLLLLPFLLCAYQYWGREQSFSYLVEIK